MKRLMSKCAMFAAVFASAFSFAESAQDNSPDFELSGGDELIKLSEDDVRVFRRNGTLKVTGSGYVEILAVGGGGGGGKTGTYGAGGGGAGGVVHKKGFFVEAGDYTVTIGDGGGIGENGGITSALGIKAYGGGAGRLADSSGKGADGASGGGAAMAYNGTANDVGGSAKYAAEGNKGNNGGGTSNPFGAGGGGGAGEAGETTGTSTPGKGGNGYECDITGEAVFYAGGGAGFRQKHDVKGGEGGGGSCVKAADGQSSVPGAGVDGLGGGGSGGAKGGSGIFIVRCKASFAEIFEGASGGIETRRNGRRIHTFTADGAFTMPVDGVVEVLLVGGGGGGGENPAKDSDRWRQGGAGGGAGGVVHVKELMLRAGTYSLGIGAGGDIGLNGGNTEAFGRIAYGGGSGARFDGRGSSEINSDAEKNYGRIGSSGASGGGSTHAVGMQGKSVSGGEAIYAGEGNLGSNGGKSAHQYAASGGGGAGGQGGDSVDSTPGIGGVGYQCDISGAMTYYAGGGAGYRRTFNVSGGEGGGGSCVKSNDGTDSIPGAGVDGLGGGGCGGAKGGSGIVIISYRLPPVGLRIVVK